MTKQHLSGSDMLRLEGAPSELIAEYEKEMRRIHSWRGRLALWWKQHFPPKSWTFICSNCGKRTSDKGSAYRQPVCSRPSCKQKYVDAIDAEADAIKAETTFDQRE